MEKMNIYGKTIALKNEIIKLGLKKSGKNDYSKYDYFELGDFLPDVIRLQGELGIDDTINITKEIASIRLTNVDDANDFKESGIPYEEAQMLAKGGAPSKVDNIQRLGATVSYLQRYLYKLVYNITEKDMVEANQKKIEQESNFDKINAIVKGKLKPTEVTAIIKELFHEPKKVNQLNAEEFELLKERIVEEIF